MRLSVAMAVACLSISILLAAEPARSAVRRTTNIPAQSLGTALQTLAKQRAFQVVYLSDAVDSMQTAGASGELTPDEALKQLLNGTDLTYRYLDESTVTVYPADEPQAMNGSPGNAPSVALGGAGVQDEKRSIWQRLRLAEATNAHSATSTSASAAEGEGSPSSTKLDEVLVTARKRTENVQRVPDAVTVFGSDKIESTGIERLGDFMSLTPNLNFQDGSAFSSGYIFISMRGIANGQQGWAPVTFTVDGARVASLDDINLGSLVDIERIEVLRGPQSALYGAGAIAGAINVITKAPTNDFELKTKAGYGKGNDRRISAVASGAITPDRLFYRVNASYRNFDGLIHSASNGIDLDFQEQVQLDGRLIFKPTDAFSADLRVHRVEEDNPSTYQDKVASPAFLNTFNHATRARRRFAGTEDRTGTTYTLKLNWESALATFSSVTGYSNLRQNALASTCVDDPDNPALDTDPITPGFQVGCLFGIALGSAAGPGENVDELFDSEDDFKTITHDMRLSSNGDSGLNWMIGSELLHRKTLNGYDLGFIVPPPGGTGADVICCEPVVHSFGRWDARKDFWWGIYGQLSYDVTDKMEVTFAGRFDKIENKNTQYTDRSKAVVVPTLNTDGVLVDTAKNNDESFQPKVQLRYDWTEATSTYVSWSKGFRSGFFNSGSFTRSEKTTNYEAGVKTRSWNGRLVTNLAAFHIDYSDQQFSIIIPEPPFRVTVTIPKTNINGFEFESNWRALESLTLSASAGYLDSKQAGGGRSPLAPKWSASLVADFVHPLIDTWDFKFNAAYTYQAAQFLERGELYEVDPTHFLNLRTGVANEHWNASFWVRNATNRRTALAQFSPFAGGYLRYQNRPISYGVEVGYNF